MGFHAANQENTYIIYIYIYPRRSMYAIYAYIGVVWGVNVGIYSIHGVCEYMYICKKL